jgi:nucleoside-diphosphate-sugar epimerase
MSKQIKSISLLGAGWLGAPLGAILAEKGYTVNGSTTRPERFEELKALGIRPFHLEIKGSQIQASADIDDFLDCDVLIINTPPGRRQPNVGEEFPERIKTISMLAQAHEIPYGLFVSSTGVYENTNDLVNEEDDPQPASESGQALLTAERYLGLIQRPLTTVLRMGGLIGKQRHPGRFLAGRENLSNGRAPVNMVHLNDAIGVCLAILEQKQWGDCFNVVADEHPTRRDYYPAMARQLDLEPPTFLPTDEASFKVVSNRKVKEELGYAFTQSIFLRD